MQDPPPGGANGASPGACLSKKVPGSVIKNGQQELLEIGTSGAEPPVTSRLTTLRPECNDLKTSLKPGPNWP
jgi:hypothetical protein